MVQHHSSELTKVLAVVLFLIASACADLQTIDDADGSAQFINPIAKSGWNTQDCPATQCSAKPPDISQIHDGTWHDTLILPGNPPAFLNVTFVGTGITVYGIQLAQDGSDPPWKNQDLTFAVDGSYITTYIFNPTSTGWAYNVPFFNVTGLSNNQHQLVMTVNPDSIVLIDYFAVNTEELNRSPLEHDPIQTEAVLVDGTETVVTFSNTAPLTQSTANPRGGASSASSQNSLAANQRLAVIIGLAVGIVMFIAIGIFVWGRIRCRRRQCDAEFRQMPFAWTSSFLDSNQWQQHVDSGHRLPRADGSRNVPVFLEKEGTPPAYSAQ